MSCFPFPHGFYESVLDIRPEELTRRGITLLLADLDNTLVPYKTPLPTEELKRWRENLEAGGVELFLLSNSRKTGRPKRFADALGIRFIGHAGKPKRGGYEKAMAQTGRTAEQTAIVGDQIFTDILGGRRSGITALLVRPIRLAGNPGRYIRYWVETPFRLVGQRRGKL
ncbi:MAG: YqeG family HAD IIIA-type phosphatase [Oscillospiraceae bacterium]|nr:YqeG family HAD IIIA-type phosphatase [Oscillospiraceae bacterium]